MDGFWNKLDLRAPAITTLKYSALEQCADGCQTALHTISDVLVDFSQLTSMQSHLESEQFVLARIIYKGNNQFRYEKRHQNLKKILRCLTRYKQLAFVSHAQKLRECFPKDRYYPCGADEYVPSRQLYEHLLAKSIAIASLMHRCAGLCLDTFLHVRQQLLLGQFYMHMAILSANLSRIWKLSEHCTQVVVTAYKKLYSVLPNLKAIPTEWVPAGEQLPCNIDCLLSDSKLETIQAPPTPPCQKATQIPQLKPLVSEDCGLDMENDRRTELSLDDSCDLGVCLNRDYVNQHTIIKDEEVSSSEQLSVVVRRAENGKWKQRRNTSNEDKAQTQSILLEEKVRKRVVTSQTNIQSEETVVTPKKKKKRKSTKSIGIETFANVSDVLHDPIHSSKRKKKNKLGAIFSPALGSIVQQKQSNTPVSNMQPDISYHSEGKKKKKKDKLHADTVKSTPVLTSSSGCTIVSRKGTLTPKSHLQIEQKLKKKQKKQ